MRILRTPVGLCLIAAGLIGCGSNNDNGGGGPALQVIGLGPAPNGNNQIAEVDQLLPVSLSVLVTEDGHPAENVTVEWATSGPGASIGSTSVSNPDGIAQSSWKLSQTSGPQTATATLDGAAGSPVTFNAIANPGNPTGLLKTGGDNQAQQTGLGFTAPLSLMISDNFGNGVPGIDVDWTVTSGSVTLDAGTSTTGADGVTATAVTAGATLGDATVKAEPTVGSSSVTFNLEVTGPQLHVTLGNNFFHSTHNGTENPAIDTVSVGSTVIWNKASPTGHTVTSTSGPVAFDSGLLVGTPNTTFSFTFNTPGTYTYQCMVHGPPMTGQIVVQ